MNDQQIKQLAEKQLACFLTGATLKLEHRIQALYKLKSCILEHEKRSTKLF